MTWVLQVLQGEGDYEEIFSVPIIQNAYKSYRISFLGASKNPQSLLWGLSLGVG